ncbi:MAG: DUF1036 domain-containing protein [Novosphingobium sp.]|nr:DUF1036 domain-containing protein [Novosphingobium sp.]
MSIARLFYLSSLMFLFGLLLAVPATQGPVAAPALAAKKCGGDGQRACTVFERPGRPCDAGLKQVAASRLELGRCQRTHTVVPRAPAYQNPAPDRRRYDRRPPARIVDDGRYNGHGGSTSIELCNKSNTSTLYAAMAYYDWGIYGDAPNWSSAGWWPIKRGRCALIGLIDDHEIPYSGQVYLMAVGGGKSWEGSDLGFCVDRDGEFRFSNADSRRCTENNILLGTPFTVTPGARNHFDFNR